MVKKTVFLLFVIVSCLIAEPIKLHPENSHYFMYKGEITPLITSGEHYGAVLNLDFDFEEYLKTLHKDGLNLTRLFVGSYVEKPGAFGINNNTLAPLENRFICPWARSDQSGYANGGNKFDLNKWDENYFRRLKKFIQTANDNDVIVEVVFFSSIYTPDNWSFNPLNPQNNINATPDINYEKVHTTENDGLLSYQKKMVEKIVTELNGFDNFYFEIQNEPWADNGKSVATLSEYYVPQDLKNPGNFWKNHVEVATQISLEWQEDIVQTIKNTEAHLAKKHLIAQNYCNFMYPIENVSDNIDIINIHYAYPKAVKMNFGYDRPIAFDESGFCGNEHLPYLKQTWRFMMSGGAVYSSLDYTFAVGSEDGTATISAPGTGGVEFRKKLGFLLNFLKSCDLENLSPDEKSIVLSPGLFLFCLSNPGKEYALFLEGNGPGHVLVNIPTGEYNATFLNYETGAVIDKIKININGQKEKMTLPEFTNGLAIKLERNE